MADVKLNSLATKTNANAAAILVKDSATQNAGAEGWITKAQLSQIIRDEIKAQMSAITSGTPDVPVLDGSTMKYMTLANFAKVVGGRLYSENWITSGSVHDYTDTGMYAVAGANMASVTDKPTNAAGRLFSFKSYDGIIQFWITNLGRLYVSSKYGEVAWTQWYLIGG